MYVILNEVKNLVRFLDKLGMTGLRFLDRLGMTGLRFLDRLGMTKSGSE